MFFDIFDIFNIFIYLVIMSVVVIFLASRKLNSTQGDKDDS
jgi:hypothetical protein